MADIYHIFADHNKDVNAMEFTTKMRKFLDGLVDLGKMQSYRLTRAKLGFRSMDLPEFHIMMEFNNMQQLDDAMTSILNNEKNIESYDVVGPICETTCKFGVYKNYPKINENEFVAITNVGAYGSSLSSNYNTRPLVAEILINKNKLRYIRKKQNLLKLINS